MKSIQIILLMCIHLGDQFPATMNKEVIDVNLKPLLDRKLIITFDHQYEVTALGREAIYQLLVTFKAL